MAFIHLNDAALGLYFYSLKIRKQTARLSLMPRRRNSSPELAIPVDTNAALQTVSTVRMRKN
jgi:hypothetical protein